MPEHCSIFSGRRPSLSAVAHGRSTRTGKIPQFPHRCRRDKRCFQQPMDGRLGQPDCVKNTGLPTWDKPGMFRTNQHHGQRPLHRVVKGLPVVAGCFRHHSCGPRTHDELTQAKDLVRRQTPRCYRRDELSLALPLLTNSNLCFPFRMLIPTTRPCTTSRCSSSWPELRASAMGRTGIK